MRTSLTIDDDLAGILKRKARELDKPYKELVNTVEEHKGVALAWVVIQGFIRITTHPKIFEHPMTVDEALGRVEEWLAQPHVQVIHPSPTHFQTWSSLLKDLGSAGNLTTDAHLAALAMERALVLHSTAADFSRFPGLKWNNPLV